MEWEKQEGTSGMWMPENVGDTLVGEVVSVTEGAFGMNYSIKGEGGIEILTPSHKVLQVRLSKVKVGDVVKLVYTGTEPPSVKGHSPTRLYDVYVRKVVTEQVN